MHFLIAFLKKASSDPFADSACFLLVAKFKEHALYSLLALSARYACTEPFAFCLSQKANGGFPLPFELFFNRFLLRCRISLFVFNVRENRLLMK